mmetsp:Transcript_52873/g.112334  ORF Transcript_52873/g.112334 Transcript_52873/m.112334 type:complete len:339 (-) Transcript_52873:239-1255(-)
MSRAESPFDPFDASFDDGVATIRSKASRASRSTKSKRAKSPAPEGAAEQSNPRALPPRLVVRLSLHEEVSSTAVASPDDEGGSLSQLSIEGKIVAKVETSNAKANTPFSLEISGAMVSLANIACHNELCTLVDEDATVGGTIGTIRCRVDVPKSVSSPREILSYSMNVCTQNMPILVQAKCAMVRSDVCRISVQIRSNLSNVGDLSDFAVVVAIPPTTIRGETLRVTRGDRGVWDSIKRVVSWKVGRLPHGESRLMSAEAEVSEGVARLLRDNPFSPTLAEETLRCPVLVRCSSESDQVSDLALKVTALEGVPATIVEHQARSYQLLHRAGNGGVEKI